MSSNTEIRLKILSMVIPQATRVSIQEPEYIIDTCKKLENYVLESKNGEKSSDSPPKRKPGRPKRTSGNDANGQTSPA